MDSINVVTTTFEVLLKTHGQQMEIAKEVSVFSHAVCFIHLLHERVFGSMRLGSLFSSSFLLMLCSLSMPVLFDAIVRW